MLKIKRLLVIVSISVISACAAERTPIALVMPVKPYIARVKDAELACLRDPVYRRLAQRDLAMRHYSQRLEAAIRATWENDNGL